MSIVRPPAFAGRFYPADRVVCERMIHSFATETGTQQPDLIVFGGVVPHAGWRYSGSMAFRAISMLAPALPETVVVFGAVHVRDWNDASLFAEGDWETPLGRTPIDAEFARRLADQGSVIIDHAVHAAEHSIEVELPFLQTLIPNAMLLPIMVRPGPRAPEIGRIVAEEAGSLGRRVAFLASTDLTHYGPGFGFYPAGIGAAGFDWAKNVNDRRFVRVVADFAAEEAVPEALEHQNACGAGAVAATLAAIALYRGMHFQELEHTSSADMEIARGVNPDNSVGYLTGVFGSPHAQDNHKSVSRETTSR